MKKSTAPARARLPRSRCAISGGNAEHAAQPVEHLALGVREHMVDHGHPARRSVDPAPRLGIDVGQVECRAGRPGARGTASPRCAPPGSDRRCGSAGACPSASASASTPSAHATAAHTRITLRICDSAMARAIPTGARSTPIRSRSSRASVGAQLFAGLGRDATRRRSAGSKCQARRDRGHPDLPGGAVAVDHDPRAIAQVQPEHAVTHRHLDVVGVDVGKRILDVLQLLARDPIEAGLVHARLIVRWYMVMATTSDSDLDVGELVEREGHETLLPSVTRSVLSTKSFVASELEAMPSATGSQVDSGDTPPGEPTSRRRRRAPARRHAPATSIGGRYIVDGQLGRGGMGRVLRVRHQALGKAFALKLIKTRDRHQPAHPRAVLSRGPPRLRAHPRQHLLDRRLRSGRAFGLFMVMELLEGQTVHAKLRHSGPMIAQGRVRRDVAGRRRRALHPLAPDPPRRHQDREHLPRPHARAAPPGQAARLRPRRAPTSAAPRASTARPSTSRPSASTARPRRRPPTSTRWASCSSSC